MVEDKPFPKIYEKKPDHRKKSFKNSHPNGFNLTFKKKKIALYVKNQAIMHLNADIELETKLLLRQI